MATITYISGGQRSGKSSTAQRLALSKSNKPFFIATAFVSDDEMNDRVERHKRDRGDNWTSIEETLFVGSLDLPDNSVVVLDCITLWLTSIFFKFEEDIDKSLEFFNKQWTNLISKSIELIVVSNEIGMGVIPSSAMARKFTDLQGWANQIIAKDADEAYLMVSGIKVRLK